MQKWPKTEDIKRNKNLIQMFLFKRIIYQLINQHHPFTSNPLQIIDFLLSIKVNMPRSYHKIVQNQEENTPNVNKNK